MSESGIAGSQGRLTPVFEKLPQTSILHEFAPTSNGWMYPLLNILASTNMICLIDLVHSGCCKVESQSSFDLHLPDDQGCWTFQCFPAISVSSFDYCAGVGSFLPCVLWAWNPVDRLDGRALYRMRHLAGPTVLEIAKILFPSEHWKKFLFLYGKSIFTLAQ